MTNFVAYVFKDSSENRDRSQFAIFLLYFYWREKEKRKVDVQNVQDYDSSY